MLTTTFCVCARARARARARVCVCVCVCVCVHVSHLQHFILSLMLLSRLSPGNPPSQLVSLTLYQLPPSVNGLMLVFPTARPPGTTLCCPLPSLGPSNLSYVKPLLKKTSLHPDNLSNYRPVSNLHFVSKITEKVDLAQLLQQLKIYKLLYHLRSVYRSGLSTETVLLLI